MCSNECIVYDGCGCVKHDHYFCTQNQELSLRRAKDCQAYRVKTAHYEGACECHIMDSNAPLSATPNLSPTRANRYAVEPPEQQTRNLDQEIEGQKGKRKPCLCDYFPCLKRESSRQGMVLPAEQARILGERSAEQPTEPSQLIEGPAEPGKERKGSMRDCLGSIEE